MKKENTNNLIWEDLGVGSLKILQEKNGYRFTSDAVILANFASAKPTDIVVEFCAGSGVISTLIAHKENPKHIYAFEIQESAYKKAKESIEANNLQHKITLINEKNSLWKNTLKAKSVDVVVCNPPYQKKGDGSVSKNLEVAISKTEIETTLEEIVLNAKKLLKKHGTFYLCMFPERMPELLAVLEKHGFGIESLFLSYPNQAANASCIFVKAINEKKQKTKVLPPLYTHNDQGDYVSTIRNLFKE